LTGGGAILHDLEVTYSLTLPIDHPLVVSDPKRLYERVHEAVASCLGLLGVGVTRCGSTDDSTPTRGPFFCFERRHEYDLLFGQDKIAGSAQRRTRQAILQHGSIIYGNRFAQQGTAVLSLAQKGTETHLRTALCVHLETTLAATLESGDWTTAELQAAEALRSRYAGDEWTKRK